MGRARAVRDPDAPVITDRKGNPEPDADLREGENVPLPGPVESFDEDPTTRVSSSRYRAAVDDYMAVEVLPHWVDAWVDHAKTKVGYELPFTKLFYRFVPPRPLAEIDAEIASVSDSVRGTLEGLVR